MNSWLCRYQLAALVAKPDLLYIPVNFTSNSNTDDPSIHPPIHPSVHQNWRCLLSDPSRSYPCSPGGSGLNWRSACWLRFRSLAKGVGPVTQRGWRWTTDLWCAKCSGVGLHTWSTTFSYFVQHWSHIEDGFQVLEPTKQTCSNPSTSSSSSHRNSKLQWSCRWILHVFTNALETWQTPRNPPGCKRWSYMFRSCLKPPTICGRMYVAVPELGDGASHATGYPYLRTNQAICLSKSQDLDTEVFQLAIRNLAALRDLPPPMNDQLLGKTCRRSGGPQPTFQELMHIPKWTCWSNPVENAGQPQPNHSVLNWHGWANIQHKNLSTLVASKNAEQRSCPRAFWMASCWPDPRRLHLGRGCCLVKHKVAVSCCDVWMAGRTHSYGPTGAWSCAFWSGCSGHRRHTCWM